VRNSCSKKQQQNSIEESWKSTTMLEGHDYRTQRLGVANHHSFSEAQQLFWNAKNHNTFVKKSTKVVATTKVLNLHRVLFFRKRLLWTCIYGLKSPLSSSLALCHTLERRSHDAHRLNIWVVTRLDYS
jgi:hypothetical protein